MLVDVLPLGVPGIGLLLEPCEEAAFLLFSVKEVIPLIDDALIASAAQCLGFLSHALVIVTLALVFGLRSGFPIGIEPIRALSAAKIGRK